MNEYLPINDSRLNQLAKRLLEEDGKEASQQRPYSLQLALEGLSSDRLNPVAQAHREEVASLAQELAASRSPEEVMWSLLLPREEGDSLENAQEQVAKMLDGAAFQEAALELAGNLWSNLGQSHPRLFGPATE